MSCVASAVAACSGGPGLPKLPAVSGLIELPKVELPKIEAPKLIIEPSKIDASSTEVYTRVARGAMACWFGAQGRLAGSHIFHADAAPAMNGGAVEIVVHERAVDQPKPWGYKAFRVLLAETTALDGSSGSGGTLITVENLRMPEAEAPRMRAEVFQWASGAESCIELPGSPAPSAAAPVVPATAAPTAMVRSAKAKTPPQPSPPAKPVAD